MHLTKSALTELLKRYHSKYQAMRTRKAKTLVLNEFIQITESERKYAAKLLTGNRTLRSSKKRGKSYGKCALNLLKRCWDLSDCLCSKLLYSSLPSIIKSIELHKIVDKQAKREVLKMSASTIDRALNQYRIRNQRRKPHPDATTLRNMIPCGSGQDYNSSRPGYVQIDTVALCGGSMAESFFWILSRFDFL